MNINPTTGVRLSLVLASTVALGLVQIVHQEVAFDRDIEQIKERVLDDYLREVFPQQLFGDQWGAAPDKATIQKRIAVFNDHHWSETPSEHSSLRIRVIRAGPVTIEGSGTESGKPISIQLASGSSAVSADLEAFIPGGFTYSGGGMAVIYLLSALALTWFFPHPARFNAFPMARDMAIIFDRKVSAGQSWGMYRLSHLGGGGRLPDIALNDFEACNDEALRIRCFMDVWSMYEKVGSNLKKSIADTDLRDEFIQTMDEGFKTAERRVWGEAPWIEDDDDVAIRFRPFVRHDLFDFAMLHLEDGNRLATLVELQPAVVHVEQPPAWLIGGYEVYYPKCFFHRLVSEIHAGLESAYSKTYDSVRVFADAQRPFISIDFHVSNLTITQRNEGRLTEFLESQFEGGLKRIVTLMDGFGDVSIFDSKLGFQLTQHKRTSERTDSGLAIRLDFRRIGPSELAFVRRRIFEHEVMQ